MSTIGNDKLSAARRFRDAAAATIGQLSAMPYLGRARQVREPRLEGMRSIGIRRFRKYLVFYIPLADHLVVLRILHGARDLDRVFVDWMTREFDGEE